MPHLVLNILKVMPCRNEDCSEGMAEIVSPNGPEGVLSGHSDDEPCRASLPILFLNKLFTTMPAKFRFQPSLR